MELKDRKNYRKGGIKKMENRVKIAFFLIMVSMFCLSPVFGTNEIIVNPNNVTQIYDYSLFGVMGGVTSIYDPINNKYTFMFNNVTITGYYGYKVATDNNGNPLTDPNGNLIYEKDINGNPIIDKNTFIIEQRVTKHANGAVAKSEDLVNNKVKIYNSEGAITDAYTIGPVDKDGDGKLDKYEADIKYNDDGSYNINWKGLIDKDGDLTTKDDQEVLDGTEKCGGKYATVEKYDAAGRLLTVEQNTWDQGKNKYETAKTNYIYDVNGSLLRTEAIDDKDKVTSITYFDSLGRQSYTIGYKDGNLKYKYTVSRNYYEGMKLLRTENYEFKEKKEDGTVVTQTQSTIYYDKHGRVNYVKNNEGKVIVKYFYNDTGKQVKINIKFGDKNLEVSSNSGQMLRVESYTYNEGNGIRFSMITYYKNNYQMVQAMGEQVIVDQTAYNKWLRGLGESFDASKLIKVNNDNMQAEGQLAIVNEDRDNDGTPEPYVVFRVNNRSTIESLISKVNSLTDTTDTNTKKSILKALGDTDGDGKLSDNEWKKIEENKGVQFTVGAVNGNKEWNSGLMGNIAKDALSGKTVTLDFKFISIDANGNLTLYANRLRD